MMRIVFALVLCVGSIAVMNERTPLKDVQITVAVRHLSDSPNFSDRPSEYPQLQCGQFCYMCSFENFATIGQMKKYFANIYKKSPDQLIIRALPRASFAVASGILSDTVLLTEICSRYSNRFLLDLENKNNGVQLKCDNFKIRYNKNLT